MTMMMNLRMKPVVLFICLLGSSLAVTGQAAGQSDRELREENARLRAQVAEQAAELEAARARIAELEARIAELEGRSDEERGEPGRSPARASEQDEYVEPEPAWVDESVPDASPRALLRALIDNYDETMAEFDDSNDLTGRDETRYVRTVEHWAARANREFRAPIEWYVVLVEAAVGGDWNRVKLQAVDPANRVELGDPFVVELSNLQLRKLVRLEDRGQIDLMLLRGAVHPDVTVNLDRFEPGPFNNPPFIGRYAEFNYAVDVRSLVPAEPPEPDEDDDEKEDEEDDGDDDDDEQRDDDPSS